MILKTVLQRIPGLDNLAGQFVKNTTPILYDLFQKKKKKNRERNISHLISWGQHNSDVKIKWKHYKKRKLKEPPNPSWT